MELTRKLLDLDREALNIVSRFRERAAVRLKTAQEESRELLKEYRRQLERELEKLREELEREVERIENEKKEEIEKLRKNLREIDAKKMAEEFLKRFLEKEC